MFSPPKPSKTKIKHARKRTFNKFVQSDFQSGVQRLGDAIVEVKGN